MATVKGFENNQIINDVRGKLGQFIFRRRNGKTVVYAKPKKIKISKRPHCVANRKRFSSVVKFAKFLLNIPILKLIWKTAKIEGVYPHSKFIKNNYKLMNVNSPTISNLITPLPCHFFIEEVILMEDNIAIVPEQQLDITADDTIILIMAIYNPIKNTHDAFELIDLSPADPQNIHIELTPEQMKIFSRYKNFILYAAVIRNRDNSVQWSNTVAIEGEIETIGNGL